MKNAERKIYLFLCYLLPPCAIVVFDILIGRTQYSFPNDAISGFFGLALNILDGDVVRALNTDIRFNFHQPAFTGMELAAVAAWAAHPTSSLDGLFHLGQAENVVAAVVAAIMMAAVAGRARLQPLEVLLLSVLATSMPTTALFASLLSSYFLSAIFLPPFAVGLWLLCRPRFSPLWIAAVTFLSLGMQIANMFPALIVVVAAAVMLVAIWATAGTAALVERLGGRFVPSIALRGVVAAASIPFLYEIAITLSAFAEVYVVPRWRLAVVVAVATAVAALPARWRGAWALVRGACLPLVLGWLAAANIFVVAWGSSAALSLAGKGGAAPHLPPARLWAEIDLIGFLRAWHWHWLPAAALVCGIGVFVRCCFATRLRWSSMHHVALVATLIVLLNALIAADVSFVPWINRYQYGQSSRYLLMCIVPVILMTLVGLQSGSSRLRLATVAATVALAVAGLADYVTQDMAAVADGERIETALERIMSAHLGGAPENEVWCLETGMPRPCEVLFGINHYRTEARLAVAPKTLATDGRIHYAADLSAACLLPGVCTGDGTRLFISDEEDARRSDDVIWRGGRGITVFRLHRSP